MKVLLVSDFYPPAIGGLERHVARLARALSARGHDVAVATVGTRSNHMTSTEDGIVVHRLQQWAAVLPGVHVDPERPFPAPIPDPGLVRGLRDVMDRFEPDVVHAHGWILSSVAASCIGRSCALVATLHDAGTTCAKRTSFYLEQTPCSDSSLRRCLGCSADHYGVLKGVGLASLLRGARPLLRRVDAFVAVAEPIAEAVERLRVARSVPMFVTPNFVDGAVPPDGPRPSCVPARGPYVLFVGTLSRFKGVDVLLEVWRRHRLDAELVLLGARAVDTPSSLPSGVSMHVDVEHASVMHAHAHSELFVLPSQFPEPSPTVLLEAMTCGKAVVASRIGGVPDIVVDGVTERLVEYDHLNGFAPSVQQLLADPDVRRGRGAAGRQRASCFETGPVVSRIESVYADSVVRRANARK